MSWLKKQTVVVPVDFSDASCQAVDVALEIAETPAGVHIIHVLRKLSSVEPGVLWDNVTDESRKKNATDALRKQFGDSRFEAAQLAVEIGDPGHEISDYAEGVAANLIVMPSHGRTGLERMLLGSVAERVTRLSHCPILILRD